MSSPIIEDIEDKNSSGRVCVEFMSIKHAELDVPIMFVAVITINGY